jgi:hypothetical protein
VCRLEDVPNRRQIEIGIRQPRARSGAELRELSRFVTYHGVPLGCVPAPRADVEKCCARGAQAYLLLGTGFTYRGALDHRTNDASDK